MFHTNASASISTSIGAPSSSLGFSYCKNFVASSTLTELLPLSSSVMRPSLAVQNDNKHHSMCNWLYWACCVFYPPPFREKRYRKPEILFSNMWRHITSTHLFSSKKITKTDWILKIQNFYIQEARYAGGLQKCNSVF